MSIDEEALKAAGRCLNGIDSKLGDKAARKVIEAYEAAKAPVDVEAAAKEIGAIRYPNATEVTPQSRTFAKACAKAWGMEYVE